MGFFDIVFPKNCLECDRIGFYVCRKCIVKTNYSSGICCFCNKASIDGFTHVRCKKKLGMDGLVVIWDYKGIVKRAIISLKYKFATEIVKELSEFILKRIRSNQVFVPQGLVLIPVPMYRKRENVRGFNQAEELARKIADGMNWKFVNDILERKENTIPQVKLRGKQRRRNLLGVFSLNKKYNIKGENFVVFDDVYTTGTTMKEAVKVLKRNGAGTVWGLAVAR